jgi:hypothetical protein
MSHRLTHPAVKPHTLLQSDSSYAGGVILSAAADMTTKSGPREAADG